MAAMLFLWLTLIAAPVLQPREPTERYRFDGVAMSRTQIVFSYAGDLWSVPLAGGTAERLTDFPGYEGYPAFSPDGQTLAFSGGASPYGTDVFTMPAGGGATRQLTYHPRADWVRGWTPDGSHILFTSPRQRDLQYELYTIEADGVFPTPLPLPQGYMGSYAADGTRLAYQPTLLPSGWQHYRGGLLHDLDIVDLRTGTRIEALPRDGSYDTNPMWVGEAVYFVSDRDGTFNLFSYDTKTKKIAQQTCFQAFGVSSASAGPGGIVLVAGGQLHRFDVATGQLEPVPVRFDDRAFLAVAPKRVRVDAWLQEASIGADGTRVAFEARGEVLTLDARSGAVRNWTRTPGAAERLPVWSPDGARLAYFSDAAGEYELRIATEDGVRAIPIEEEPTYYREPTWSPDGRYLAFSGQRLELWLADVEAGTTRKVATSEYVAQGAYTPSWSPDGRYLAYARADANGLRSVYVYDVRTDAEHRVSDGRTHTVMPVFDANGHYLYFAASNNARLDAAGDVGWALLSSQQAAPLVSYQLQVAVLAADGIAPLYPAIGLPNPDALGQPRAASVRIDTAGIERRIFPLPAERRQYVDLRPGRPGELFARAIDWPSTPGEAQSFLTPLYRYRLEASRELEEVVDDLDAVHTSADGASLLYQRGSAWYLAGTADPTAKRALSFGDATLEIDLQAEWRQMFDEVWRKVRDTFYDPNLHGQDLEALRAHYSEYLPAIRTRDELNGLFDDMLAHLSVSHLRIGGGDSEPTGVRPPRVGLLGADYRVSDGRYRFTRILYSGHPMSTNPLHQAPLDQPGLDVREGEYLLAVDGEEITAERNLYSYFQNRLSRPYRITVGPNPSLEGARVLTVVPVSGENGLREANWVAANRALVEQRSGGRLGYLYIGDYGGEIQTFIRELIGQQDKQGLVIDQRYNGGGVTADVLIEMLLREPIYHYAYRYGADFTVSPNTVRGPKVLVVNEWNGSAAETFPLMFKLKQVGPVVGRRTFGAGIGAALYQAPLVDGGFVGISNRAAFNPQAGTWDIENHGVVPDVEVEITLQDWRAGRDPQLETAVDIALRQLEDYRPPEKKRPAYPIHPNTP